MGDQMWTALGGKVEPDWSPERERAIRATLARRVSRRRAVKATVAVGSAGLIALVGLTWVSWRSAVQPAAPLVSETTPARNSRPDSGSETVIVTRLSPDTVLAPLPERGGRGFALQAGAARFSVPHDAGHSFVVSAGDVTIEDLGTTFTVRYLTPHRLSIAVEEGRVRVRGGDTDTEVSAGASMELPVSPAGEVPRRPQRPAVASSSWRRLAERGQYDEAQKALRRAGPTAVRDDTADLLLAADAARLSGHPAEAVPYLERVLRSKSQDPRAGLAAFTLGRVLLDELGRPREAIDAFALARSSGGPLAEDALAREVEAASRAGDVARSRDLALLYQKLYPNGRRGRAVSRFGGFD